MKRILTIVALTTLALLALAQTTYPLVITKVETKDWEGVTKTSFRHGEILVVETEISIAPTYYAVSPIGYLQIVTMRHLGSMLGLLLTRASIAAGETKTFGGGMGIRSTDPIGTYDIKVLVWNGFPSEMRGAWAPLAEERVVSITVTG